MKKILFTGIIFLVISASFAAHAADEVIFRFSRQDDIIKMVFEANDNLIKGANTVATLSQIKVEFPAAFDFKKPRDFMFDIIKSDRFITIPLINIIDVKAYKLTSPARLFIQLKTGPAPQQTVAAQKTEQKPAQEPPKPAEQKKPQTPEQPAEKKQKVNIVVIDAGHGGYDFGIISGDNKEKDVNLNIARDISTILSKKGYKPFLARKTDQPLSITDRINISGSRKPDLFISIHASSQNKFVINVAQPDDAGVDAALKLYSLSVRQGRHIEKSRAFAQLIGQALKEAFGNEFIIREIPLPVLLSMDAPAILIEYPFAESAVYDQKARDKFTNAVLKGISFYEQ